MMRFPTDTQRLSVLGATGTGKTVAAGWHLSHRDFHVRPWLIYNWKGDEFLDSIPYVRHIGLNELPKTPGVYMAHPRPDEEEAVEWQMWQIWERGGMGVFIDEGYMVGQRNRGYRALLTQGRSKQVPMIVLAQRPSWLDKFTFTESEFFQVFRLQFDGDVDSVRGFIRNYQDEPLPDFYSRYFDVGRNELLTLQPVPKPDVILATFERRLRRRQIAV